MKISSFLTYNLDVYMCRFWVKKTISGYKKLDWAKKPVYLNLGYRTGSWWKIPPMRNHFRVGIDPGIE